MEQLDEGKYQIDTSDQDAPVYINKETTEARDIETKEHNNNSTRPRRENSGKGADRPKMKFGGKKHGTQFINTKER